MKYLDVRLRLPDELLHPMQAFIRDGDAVEYEEMLAWRVRPDKGIEYALYYVEGALAPFERAADDIDSIIEWRLAPIDETSAHVWACEETRPETRAWRTAFADRRLIVLPPIRVDADAEMALTIVGDGDHIQGLIDDMPPAVGVTVERIGNFDRRGGTVVGPLTDRQLEVVSTALELGYYEVPRTASLATVAEAVGCSESTASVVLRRAERDLIGGVFDRFGGTGGG